MMCPNFLQKIVVISTQSMARAIAPRECDFLELITKTGQRIPEVPEIWVLGMLISETGAKIL